MRLNLIQAPRPLRGVAYFAGLYRTWCGDYGSKKEPNEGDHVLFGFLTMDANELVRPVHAKAIPVVLIDQSACDEWLSAPEHIVAVQARVLPADALEIVGDEEAAQYVGSSLK